MITILIAIIAPILVIIGVLQWAFGLFLPVLSGMIIIIGLIVKYFRNILFIIFLLFGLALIISSISNYFVYSDLAMFFTFCAIGALFIKLSFIIKNSAKRKQVKFAELEAEQRLEEERIMKEEKKRQLLEKERQENERRIEQEKQNEIRINNSINKIFD